MYKKIRCWLGLHFWSEWITTYTPTITAAGTLGVVVRRGRTCANCEVVEWRNE